MNISKCEELGKTRKAISQHQWLKFETATLKYEAGVLPVQQKWVVNKCVLKIPTSYYELMKKLFLYVHTSYFILYKALFCYDVISNFHKTNLTRMIYTQFLTR
jgi:hypothetical protein